MPAASKLSNEAERLQALLALHLLDTEPTAEFDVFPALASRVFSTPIAAFSLVDKDRQWFKSSIGMPVPETPVEQSFCAHAILSPQDVLVVPDAKKDVRFVDNPLVTGPFGLRFYAGVPVLSPSGHPVGALCVIDRVPRQPSAEELDQLRLLAVGVTSALRLHAALVELQLQADTDPLTRLLNRAGFERQARYSGRDPETDGSVGLLILGLDGFASINDLFGHAGGDAALREVARRLHTVTKETDLIGRFGGDEFCILARDLHSTADLQTLAARVHEALAEPLIIQNQSVPLTTSIGIAAGPWSFGNQDQLVRQADGALTRAKQAGRGTTRLASAPSSTQARQAGGDQPGGRQIQGGQSGDGRSSLQESLRQALAPGQEPFSLALQPIHAASTGALTGFEALVRWPLPGGQVRMPNDFIPAAEATGLIVQLDRWVLNRACQLASAWPRQLQIASNLSAANFFAGDLVDTVREALANTRLEPARLKLEITETVLLHDRARVRAVVTALKELGVHVILDDFGAGHASLAYLRDYPFDGLKIDRSFTAGLDTDSTSRPLIRAMIAMSRALHLEVTAEGVETQTQLATLREEGVDSVQGYLFGRPTAPEKAALLAGRPRQTFKSRIRLDTQVSMA
jgi:diguanylate cyclase (GGDEF)-like protein